MVMSSVVDAPVASYATLQTKSVRPPRPPAGLAAVLLDDHDIGSELVVAVDTDDSMTVQLHAHGLDASGASPATVRRFRDQSCFALADIPVIGYDRTADRSVSGKISIGLTWAGSSGSATPVAGTALAEGDWTGGLFRFGTVSQHSFNRRVVRLISTQPFPPARPRLSAYQ